MVVVRLQRRGTKKMPHHRIVVTERSRAPRGAYACSRLIA